MKWYRMYAEFAYDPKIQSLSETLQRRFVMLLCLKCNDTLKTLDDEEIAYALKITEEELLKSKEVFIKKDFITKDWGIQNWDKRQYVSDDVGIRVKKYREKKKSVTLQKRSCNKSVTAPETETETETEKKQNKYEYLSNKNFKETFNDYLDMRKKKKVPPTDKAKELVLKKLHKYSISIAIEMLEQSIVSSWADVYPLKKSLSGTKKEPQWPELKT